MPNQYKNKVVYFGDTLIDLSGDTLDPSKVLQGYTGHDATGAPFTGTYVPPTGAISVVDTSDSHGGTVRTITALDISDTTAVASNVSNGKYFYTKDGVKTAGTRTSYSYEQGLWRPSSDTARGEINFTKNHTSAPFFIRIVDNADEYISTSYTAVQMTFVNWNALFASSRILIHPTAASTVYGEVDFVSLVGSSSYSYQTQRCTSLSGSSTSSLEYWAATNKFYPTSYSSTIYWRSGRAYRWVAVFYEI